MAGYNYEEKAKKTPLYFLFNKKSDDILPLPLEVSEIQDNRKKISDIQKGKRQISMSAKAQSRFLKCGICQKEMSAYEMMVTHINNEN